MSITTADLPGLRGAEAHRVATHQYDELISLLASLEPGEWDKPTDCELWSVKDITCHILGCAEGWLSIKELLHQYRAGFRRKDEMGDILAGMNQQQVDDRNQLPTDTILDRCRSALPTFVNRRIKWAKPGRAIPLYDPVVIKLSNVAYLLNTIYSRDALAHRIDIARATGRELEISEPDHRLMHDILRDWGRRRSVDATVRLDGGPDVVLGAGTTASITGSLVDLARVLAGRAEPDVLALDGDRTAATAWLTAGVPF